MHGCPARCTGERVSPCRAAPSLRSSRPRSSRSDRRETPILAARLYVVMRVAITGGTGYAGPAVVEEILRAGHEVVVVEHRTPVPIGAHSRLRRARGDVRDVRALQEAFEGCDAVVHLVAILREEAKKGITF